MRNPNNYSVYLKAHALAVRIATLVSGISTRRHPGLPAQLRRAAASVPAIFSEGCAHSSQREFARFIQLSLASAGEVEYHITFAGATGALTVQLKDELHSANTEVRRMMASLLRRVRDDLTEDDDDDSVSAMQRRRSPRPPRLSSAKRLPINDIESHH